MNSYISERIANLEELEELIQDAVIKNEVIKTELNKPTPSLSSIELQTKGLGATLKKVDEFEFRIERRAVN